MSGFKLREFRQEDARALEGIEAPFVAFGQTLTHDGAPVGYGGIFFPYGAGQPWLFFHVAPDLRSAAKIAICRACLLGIANAKDELNGANILTYLDFRKPRAREFLAWMGFEPSGRTVEIGNDTFEVWQCRA